MKAKQLISLILLICSISYSYAHDPLSDTLLLERHADNIQILLENQIKINAQNETKGRLDLNDYIIRYNITNSDEDTLTTKYFKIQEANNGKALWDIQDPTNRSFSKIRSDLLEYNESRNEEQKAYLLLVSVYDYDRDINNWYTNKQKYANSVYDAVDNIQFDWDNLPKYIKLGDKEAKESVAIQQEKYDTIRQKYRNSFIRHFVHKKLKNVGSRNILVAFTSYEYKKEKKHFDLNTTLYAYEDAIPKTLFDWFGYISYNVMGKQKVSNSIYLQKTVSIFLNYLNCKYQKGSSNANIDKVAKDLERVSLSFIKQVKPKKHVIICGKPEGDPKFEELEWKLNLHKEKSGIDVYFIIDGKKEQFCNKTSAAEIVKKINQKRPDLLQKESGAIVFYITYQNHFFKESISRISNLEVSFEYAKPDTDHQARAGLAKKSAEILEECNWEYSSPYTAIDHFGRGIYRSMINKKDVITYLYIIKYNGDIIKRICNGPLIDANYTYYNCVVYHDENYKPVYYLRKKITELDNTLKRSNPTSFEGLMNQNRYNYHLRKSNKKALKDNIEKAKKHFRGIEDKYKEINNIETFNDIGFILKDSTNRIKESEIEENVDKYVQYLACEILDKRCTAYQDSWFEEGFNRVKYEKTLEGLQVIAFVASVHPLSGAAMDGIVVIYALAHEDYTTAGSTAAFAAMSNFGDVKRIVNIFTKKSIRRTIKQADVFVSARQFVRNKYGQDFLNEISTKVKLGDIKLIDHPSFTDVIIHSNASGDKFLLYIGSEVKEITPEKLASLLLKLDHNKPIRVLSCNNLESARILSQCVPMKVIATDAKVRLFGNGHVELVPRHSTPADHLHWKVFEGGKTIKQKIHTKTGKGKGKSVILGDLANTVDDVLPEVFGGARQYVRNTYPNGQDILNSLTQKFGNNQGAAAEIIKKFGDDGLAILNKSTVNSIDDAAKELIQGKTLYRYVNETSYNFDKLLTKGQIDAAPSQFPGYTTLDNISDASQAKSILQLPKQPTWVAEFDAAQIIDDVSFPMGNFNNASYKEVVTRSYPDFGVGGGSQFITTSEIKISRLKNFATGEIIDFTHTAKRTYAAKGQGTDLIRTTFSANNTKIQIKSGHGFNRPHATGDFANTNLTMNQVEDAVVDDFNIRISNGDNIPIVGSTNFNGPANFTLDIDGVSVGYRVVNLQDGSVSISTYWPN